MISTPETMAMWASMTSWFTPTVLFCVLNLMIGTILITSRLKPEIKRNQLGHHHRDEHSSPPLVRVPSLVDRVKSFKLERVTSFNFSNIYHSEKPVPCPSTTHYTSPPDHPPAESTEAMEESHLSHVTGSESGTYVKAPAEKVMKKSASEKMVASAAEKEDVVALRRPATVRERKTKDFFGDTATFCGEDEMVDAKADDFINRFRQQLKLQRLDSFLRYKEMLKRGT